MTRIFSRLYSVEKRKTFLRESMDNICEALKAEILRSDAAEETKQNMLERIKKLCNNMDITFLSRKKWEGDISIGERIYNLHKALETRILRSAEAEETKQTMLEQLRELCTMMDSTLFGVGKKEEEIFIRESMDNICEALEAEILKSAEAEETKQTMLVRLRKLCNIIVTKEKEEEDVSIRERKENMDNICKALEAEILKSAVAEETKQTMLISLRKLCNIMPTILSRLLSVEKREIFTRESMDNICEALEAEILKSDVAEDKKQEMLLRLRKLCNTETNIMLVGATGCGKSSTINALFSCNREDEYVEIAKVGSKADPETRDIERYRIGNLILWDTPGLGDGTEIDEPHKEVITELLREQDKDGNALIDLVLVILDSSTRDLGTSYQMLNEVIIPELKDETGRILIALNQADIAMKTGRHWDYEKNEPDEMLTKFLEEKVVSIKERIKEDTGMDITPIYYCAGYEEDSGDVVHPYNLSKLLYYILNALPAEKRAAVFGGMNTDSEQYRHNDDDMDYNEGVKESLVSMADYIADGINQGGAAGFFILGAPGMVVGSVIGAFVGGIRGIFNHIF
ncbi:MAG: 50S ribosome-binding GTPase [Bacillus sp. (in: Bacteria)]|nr:50S ribosome-binding GTPase [Bacillus sp. (in: firmicutes)]MCM1426461.1 50S ribosome-binding GTPase [Eubacterium sp.]